VDEFDFVIIGAGAAGEAAAHEARRRRASVAIIERELLGGSCPFWACMPSKALLHAAGIHAIGGDYPWSRASEFRDEIINRVGVDWPDDGGHLKRLSGAGAEVIRGTARVAGQGLVNVDQPGRGDRQVRGRNVVIAVGTNSTIPDLPGLEAIEPWTNREATSLRTLPKSLVVLGGGPTGVEMSQALARYGVTVRLVHPQSHVNHRDHPRNSEFVAAGLRRDGVELHLGVRATRIDARAGERGAHRITLSDCSTVDGDEVLFSIGRTAPLADIGLETIGVALEEGRVKPDENLRIADSTYVIGDPAGPEMHTHLAHYQGEMCVAIALGDDVKPDYRAIPRAMYTDPEAAGVGQRVEEAVASGRDAFELTADLSASAKGYVSEAAGHATIVVDRSERTLVGAFICGPGASEAIHMAVLAIKTNTPIEVLADTITAFPTTTRVMGSLFVQAARQLRAAPGRQIASET
jgi:pyruvate/2-oxoglutarate dehydrogenase complex dihydrolipoamide dehydrogenase (E3) component